VNKTDWLVDISYNCGGLVVNLGNWGSVGASVIYADYGGNIIGTRRDPGELGYVETTEPGESLDVGAYAVGLSYARRLTNKFSIGGQVKYAYQHLGENLTNTGNISQNECSGMAYDFGTIFYPGFKSLRLGMSIRNFSPEFKYVEETFELPLTFTLGFAMDVLDLMSEEHSNSLLISVDATHPRDYTERINVGGEFTFMDIIALRVGYKYNYDEEGLTGGAGLKYSLGRLNVELGYSYSQLDVFDSVNRISVGLSY
ncbi:PorV/PorQ family protein, partial [bacterium]|nr:PorV/PorQ family protein [bacterium]